MLEVYRERQDEAWLRASSLAVWVRGQIWGDDPPSAYQQLDWNEPPVTVIAREAVEDSRFDLLWEQLARRQGGPMEAQ